MTETAAPTIDADLLDHLLDEHAAVCVPRLERLWSYYRNPLSPAGDGPRGGDENGGSSGRWYSLAQEQGLPPRITRPGGVDAEGGTLTSKREVVIENDIAWRIHALVDFMFGKPVALQSTAPGSADATPGRATLIETFLRDAFDRAGGVAFFQDLALLGAVYGYADVLVRVSENAIDLELIEPPRAIPVLNPDDYRKLDAYVLHYRRVLNTLDDASPHEGFLSRLRDRLRFRAKAQATTSRACVDCTEVWTSETFTRFHRDPNDSRADLRTLIDEAVNPLGRIPVVHIQNLAQPFFYEGLSEVEPLIPLQDELNTRLSDRANRVTFQSFKMYLGKGIEGFIDRPVGPGQMWRAANRSNGAI